MDLECVASQGAPWLVDTKSGAVRKEALSVEREGVRTEKKNRLEKMEIVGAEQKRSFKQAEGVGEKGRPGHSRWKYGRRMDTCLDQTEGVIGEEMTWS